MITLAEVEKLGARHAEEMVTRTLEDGAQVWVIRGAHSPVAARLYSPAAAAA